MFTYEERIDQELATAELDLEASGAADGYDLLEASSSHPCYLRGFQQGLSARARQLFDSTAIPLPRGAKWLRGYSDALHKTYDQSIDLLDEGYGAGFSHGLTQLNKRNLQLIEDLVEDCDELIADISCDQPF